MGQLPCTQHLPRVLAMTADGNAISPPACRLGEALVKAQIQPEHANWGETINNNYPVLNKMGEHIIGMAYLHASQLLVGGVHILLATLYFFVFVLTPTETKDWCYLLFYSLLDNSIRLRSFQFP